MVREIIERKINEFTGGFTGESMEESMEGKPGESTGEEPVSPPIVIPGKPSSAGFSRLIEEFTVAYVNGRSSDAELYLSSIISSPIFRHAVEKTIEETSYWCIRRIHGLGGYSDRSILYKRLQAIRGAYPLTSLVRHIAIAYCDDKGYAFSSQIVLIQVAQVVLGESLRKGKRYIGVIQLSPGDIEDIVKHYWRKHGLKDTDLLREAVVLGVFINALTHHLLIREPKLYAGIIRDIEKRVRGFMGVEQG